MGLGSERDLVPLGAGFDIVKRGYSRTQVEEHLERLDSDLRLIAADRDAAVSQAADLARQMERARSELDDLRGQVNRLSLPPTTLEGLSERLQRMLKLAQEEASDTKARAEADAGQIRARSEADAAALRNRYEKLIAEVDGRRVELETEHRELVEKSQAEIALKSKQADDERVKADEEAAARRTQIDDDFEIAMAARRTEAMKTLAEQEATSKTEAQRRVREASEEAARISAQIGEEQRTSHADAERRVREATDEANRIRTQVNDDAGRIRAQVAEEQRASKADAERRVREATEEANRRRHDAVTESQARLQDSAEEANRRVREATEEANRRISHAVGRVESLRALRAQIAEQLHSAHALISNATPALDPLPEEQEGTAKPAPKNPTRKPGGTERGMFTPTNGPSNGGWPVSDTGPEDQNTPAGQGAQTSSATPAPSAAPATPAAPAKAGASAQATPAGQGSKNGPAGQQAPAVSPATATATTKRTPPVVPPAGGNQSGQAGQGHRPGAQPTVPNRPAQGVRREPTGKR